MRMITHSLSLLRYETSHDPDQSSMVSITHYSYSLLAAPKNMIKDILIKIRFMMKQNGKKNCAVRMKD